jgi:hypothetical protein
MVFLNDREVKTVLPYHASERNLNFSSYRSSGSITHSGCTEIDVGHDSDERLDISDELGERLVVDLRVGSVDLFYSAEMLYSLIKKTGCHLSVHEISYACLAVDKIQSRLESWL